jgi:hypothetical protein
VGFVVLGRCGMVGLRCGINEIEKHLDLLVDCVTQRVIPRDPAGATFEIE